jgi:hypothetical protein
MSVAVSASGSALILKSSTTASEDTSLPHSIHIILKNDARRRKSRLQPCCGQSPETRTKTDRGD